MEQRGSDGAAFHHALIEEGELLRATAHRYCGAHRVGVVRAKAIVWLNARGLLGSEPIFGQPVAQVRLHLEHAGVVLVCRDALCERARSAFQHELGDGTWTRLGVDENRNALRAGTLIVWELSGFPVSMECVECARARCLRG